MNKTNRIITLVTRKTKQELKKICYEEGITMSGYVREAIQEKLQKKRRVN